MGWLSGIFGKGTSSVLDSTANVLKEGTKMIDEIFTTEEERLAAKKDLYQMTILDRDSARDMYEKDSSLQKVFALFYLLAWIVLTALIMNYFVFETVDLKDWQIAFVSTIYGGISTKLSTIIDFLFGGSAHKNTDKR